jgi:hypothetical protein
MYINMNYMKSIAQMAGFQWLLPVVLLLQGLRPGGLCLRPVQASSSRDPISKIEKWAECVAQVVECLLCKFKNLVLFESKL